MVSIIILYYNIILWDHRHVARRWPKRRDAAHDRIDNIGDDTQLQAS